ncbi:unnamed protein product [Soboliphyme baturini]|uniref:Calpain catalytic domain-containing protein n=1 Tax=Soboliphyme baturini TaxID=241478 RepID=A0A183IPP5_9BILA|nr:unnamed protein product [Soboliphyme baturini]
MAKIFCLTKNILWKDPDFPANDQSIYRSKVPKEISKNAKFVENVVERFDVKQGKTSNCWFLAGLTNLTINMDLFTRVVPIDQSFKQNYCGVVRFNFWHYGEWVEICIDDRLPTYKGKLYFLHSSEKNEFWSALLEKAYAKLNDISYYLKCAKKCKDQVLNRSKIRQDPDLPLTFILGGDYLILYREQTSLLNLLQFIG